MQGLAFHPMVIMVYTRNLKGFRLALEPNEGSSKGGLTVKDNMIGRAGGRDMGIIQVIFIEKSLFGNNTGRTLASGVTS
jgi:hypothetical protein